MLHGRLPNGLSARNLGPNRNNVRRACQGRGGQRILPAQLGRYGNDYLNDGVTLTDCMDASVISLFGLAGVEALFIPLIALLPMGIFFAFQYNLLIRIRKLIAASWANLETELKRRYELIPSLVAAVQSGAAPDQEVLDRVSQLRTRCLASRGSPSDQARDEVQLVEALKRLHAVVEACPSLKANEQFSKLQQEFVAVETRIQAARRTYNGHVRQYRTKCEKFPSNLVAGSFHFPNSDFFNVSPSVAGVSNAEFDRRK